MRNYLKPAPTVIESQIREKNLSLWKYGIAVWGTIPRPLKNYEKLTLYIICIYTCTYICSKGTKTSFYWYVSLHFYGQYQSAVKKLPKVQHILVVIGGIVAPSLTPVYWISDWDGPQSSSNGWPSLSIAHERRMYGRHYPNTPYGGFHKSGYPNSWLVYRGKSHLQMDDLGVPPMETPIWPSSKSVSHVLAASQQAWPGIWATALLQSHMVPSFTPLKPECFFRGLKWLVEILQMTIWNDSMLALGSLCRMDTNTPRKAGRKTPRQCHSPTLVLGIAAMVWVWLHSWTHFGIGKCETWPASSIQKLRFI